MGTTKLEDMPELRGLNWQEGNWSGINIDLAQNESNYYYRQNSDIFIQRKNGKVKSDFIPYHLKCGSPAKVLSVRSPDYGSIHPGQGMEGRTMHRFYCKKCEGKPRSGRISEIVIE